MDSKQHGKISKYVSESVLWVADWYVDRTGVNSLGLVPGQIWACISLKASIFWLALLPQFFLKKKNINLVELYLVLVLMKTPATPKQPKLRALCSSEFLSFSEMIVAEISARDASQTSPVTHCDCQSGKHPSFFTYNLTFTSRIRRTISGCQLVSDTDSAGPGSISMFEPKIFQR